MICRLPINAGHQQECNLLTSSFTNTSETIIKKNSSNEHKNLASPRYHIEQNCKSYQLRLKLHELDKLNEYSGLLKQLLMRIAASRKNN